MKDLKEFNFGIDFLTVDKALALSNGKLKGILNDKARTKVKVSAEIVKNIVQGDKAVYGINTGFGPLCTTAISAADTHKLQENILKSHAVGVGKHIDNALARLMLVLKIHALAKGFSGVTQTTLDRMIWHLENNLIPVVPEQGSVGASGDLAPLSHLFLPLIGLGKLNDKGIIYQTEEVLARFGKTPVRLNAKEGLAMINGTQFMAAYGVKAVERMANLLDHADLISAMMIDGLKGSEKPFDERLHNLRPFAGTQKVACNIRNLLKDSEIVNSHINCNKVQDPYSLRCIPQIHGASRNAYIHLKEIVETEINSVTDNPIVFNDSTTVSGGNFHGQPIALSFDYACLAVSEIGNVSDRRIYLSLEGNTEGVPKLLVRNTGINSGFMILQYTSAALASENKGLCFPASADSIPTSLGQEDHVSMGSIGGRKLHKVINNVEQILAIELFCATQALDFHVPLKSGKVLSAIHELVRSKIPHIEEDQIMYEMIEILTNMIKSNQLLNLACSTAASSGLNFTKTFQDGF